MKYMKAEVMVLGEAVRLIEQLVKGNFQIPEGPNPKHRMNPAYDLDD